MTCTGTSALGQAQPLGLCLMNILNLFSLFPLPLDCSSVHQVKYTGLLHEPLSRVCWHRDVTIHSVPESHNLELSFYIPVQRGSFQEDNGVGSSYSTLPNRAYLKIRKFDKFSIAPQLAGHFLDRALREVCGTLGHLPIISVFPTVQELNYRELG